MSGSLPLLRLLLARRGKEGLRLQWRIVTVVLVYLVVQSILANWSLMQDALPKQAAFARCATRMIRASFILPRLDAIL